MRISEKIKRRFLSYLLWPAEFHLMISKRWQYSYFKKLHKKLPLLYKSLAKYDADHFMTPHWRKFNERLETCLLPMPNFSFLRNRAILNTMFTTAGGNLMKSELKFLREQYSKKQLEMILDEDAVGRPVLMDHGYSTSHNTIHHAYHLAKYLDCTHKNLSQINTIVEWGGGYGNTAKLFRRINNKPHTYILIDTPLLICLQWLYLATILGPENIHIIANHNDKIRPNKINLLPVGLVGAVAPRADFFISTWGISESSPEAQDFVKSKSWFGAQNLLIAYQESNDTLPHAGRIKDLVLQSGAKIRGIEFLPKNYYAFL